MPTPRKFEIDSEIRKAPLQKRWQSSDKAISFGHRALQVALEEISHWESYRVANQFNYFEKSATLAGEAHKTLQELLNHIGPSGLKPGRTVSEHRWERSRRVEIRISRKKPTGDFVSAADAKREAETLAVACSLLGEMQTSASREAEILQSTRTNEPDHRKRAFVYRLAEAWIFLTGKRPGRGRYQGTNPFLRFVNAAANDSGRFDNKDEEDFFSALKWALETLDRFERIDEKGESKQSISGIAARGPVWT